MKVTIYGHVTLDDIEGELMIGGPPNYGGITLSDLFETKPIIVTSCNPSDMTGFIREAKDKLRYIVILSKETTKFSFPRRGHEHQMELLTKADKIEAVVASDLAIVSPVCREITNSVLKQIRSQSKFLAIDIQGFARTGEIGIVEREYFLSDFHAIESANLIKASDYEISFLLDLHHFDRDELGQLLSSVELLISRGRKGATVLYQGKQYDVSAPSVSYVNTTGAGDVLITAYAYLRAQNTPIQESLSYAVAVASVSISYDGLPHSMSRDQVANLAHNLTSRITETPIDDIIDVLSGMIPKATSSPSEETSSDPSATLEQESDQL